MIIFVLENSSTDINCKLETKHEGKLGSSRLDLWKVVETLVTQQQCPIQDYSVTPTIIFNRTLTNPKFY